MKRIIIAQFCHETNSFNPKKADKLAFENYRWQIGEELIEKQRGVSTDLGGFIDYMEKHSDITLIPTVGLETMPCGHVTDEVYEYVLESVLKAINDNSPIDGVFFHFHGAMVAEGHQDVEGDLCAEIRRVIGKDVPFMGTLDLHANVTKKMVENIDVLIPYDCYPHTDISETGQAVAEVFLDTLYGKVKPVMAYRRIPFLLPLFPTDNEEIRPLYELAKSMRKKEGVLTARFTHGFFASDIEEMGMSVLVITNDNKALAEELAEQLASFIDLHKKDLIIEYPDLDKVLDYAIENQGPTVIADSSDNPGAGGFGDSTHILRRILERNITGAAVATILDPESVIQCEKAGVGNIVELSLGGWSPKQFSGGALNVSAYVKAIMDGRYVFKGKMNHGLWGTHGKAAVVEIKGNVVIITSLPRQPFDLEVFRSHGIAPEEQKILVVKSSIHFRADYGKIAKKMFTLALNGVASPDPKKYEYKNFKGQ